MKAIEVARKFAALGSVAEACNAYVLAIHESSGINPEEEMEAAVYIFQNGGNYKLAYTSFQRLYNQGFFREDCFHIMRAAFYEPNVKSLKSRYAKNCKLLEKYPYLFRKDFLPFDKLPIQFFPYDEKGFIPFYVSEQMFGEYIDFQNPVISRNFFHDLDNPILAQDVYSQYELEYLNDNVRKSEYIARENHIYLHYTDWGQFCAHLQCLNLRPLLKEKKNVFLIGDEVEQYPIDFKKRFGIDYSACPVKPLAIRECNRLIWHTQFSTHNGGDLFNEVFDAHPNLIASTSFLMDSMEETIAEIHKILNEVGSVNAAVQRFGVWDPPLISELYLMKNRTDKDVLVGMLLRDIRIAEKEKGALLDATARIVPAVFFQPHFPNVIYSLHADKKGHATLHSKQYDTICNSPIFKGFKYVKSFTPMRRMTTSYGATVKFMYNWNLEKGGFMGDVVSQRVLNRSYMIDWQNRLFKDCILVRFEDAKLNPKATFTALAAFLDLPYHKNMEYGSAYGKKLDYGGVLTSAFDTAPVYKTYDDYASDSERCYIEYFLRDVYEYYGYDFKYYDGSPMDMKRIETLVSDFSKEDYFTRDLIMKNQRFDEELTNEARQKKLEELVDVELEKGRKRRINNARLLMRGLYFVNKDGQPLHMMPKLELDPDLLENPIYH